jgi:hypothetical protein
VGDPLGTEATHAIAAGMGGIRTAGDLVLRMQLTHKMKIDEAKAYVADVVRMAEVREDLNIGIQEPFNGATIGMEAKFRISELLGIKINSVERFKERAGI